MANNYVAKRSVKHSAPIIKAASIALIGFMFVIAAAQAQGQAIANNTGSADVSDTADKSASAAPGSLVGVVQRPPRPLPTILGMSDQQRQQLDRLYDAFAVQRVEQEEKIARWQKDLQQAQSPTTFDERKASGLIKSINEAGQRITEAFLKARGKALEALTPAQRAQLPELARLANAPEAPGAPAKPARDGYYQLLLMPVEELLQSPVDIQAVHRLAAERNNRDADRYLYPSYGLGYGYGDGSYFGLFGGYGSGGFGFGFGSGHHHHR